MLFTLLGFICVCWLLASPGWRVFAIKRRNEDEVRTQVNGWLVTWFVLSLLAPVFWIWQYTGTCKSNKATEDKNKVVCPWRDMDAYMVTVLALAVCSNLFWLIYLCFIDLKKILLQVGMGASGACVLVIIIFTFDLSNCWGRLQLAGWIAFVLGAAATCCRAMSIGHQEFSLFALSVGLAAVIPELMWILNEICVEQYTEVGKKCGLYDVFFKKNFHWKLSWTLNSLIRLPELISLIRQIDAQRRRQWRRHISTRVRRFFGRDAQG